MGRVVAAAAGARRYRRRGGERVAAPAPRDAARAGHAGVLHDAGEAVHPGPDRQRDPRHERGDPACP